jgi:peptide/nickel transport system substrate-binding protein
VTRRSNYLLAAAFAATLGLMTGPVQAGKSDDTLNWATDREVSVVDTYYNRTRELVVMGHLGWDTLMFRDLATNEYKPLLATKWEWKDNTTLIVELREGVKFHDGSDFDADDVVYTINHVTNKDNGVVTYSNVKYMKNAEKLGPYKVQINLQKPFPATIAYLAGAVFMMPSGHYDNAPTKPDGKKDYGSVKPNGTGPYKWKETKSGEYVLWEKNENYFDGPKGKPSIGKVKFRTVKEMNTQIAELLTGGLDWMWDVPKDQAERLEQGGQVTVENAKTMRVSYIAFDVDGSSPSKQFKDKKVREAVAHAINREAITKNLVGPASVVINAPCHPDQFGCMDAEVPKWSYDPEKSKALLKEAGYPDGFETEIYAYRQREYTEAVIGDLAKVGIKAKLNFMAYRALRDLAWKGETPMHHMTWGSNSIPDASAIVGVFFEGGKDDPADDPEVNETIKAAGTTTDPKEREALYKKAQSKIVSELYWLPMFTYAKYYAFSKDLDFKPTSDEIPRFYNAKWK